VIATFTDGGTLHDLLVVYRAGWSRSPSPRSSPTCSKRPRPEKRAEHAARRADVPHLHPGGVVAESVVPNNFAAGGLVRSTTPARRRRHPPAARPGRRVADRPSSRTGCAWRCTSTRHARAGDAEDLKRVNNPEAGLALLQASLFQAGQFDVAERLTLQWTAEQKGLRSLVSSPCHCASWPARAHHRGGRGQRPPALTWQDERTPLDAAAAPQGRNPARTGSRRPHAPEPAEKVTRPRSAPAN